MDSGWEYYGNIEAATLTCLYGDIFKGLVTTKFSG